MQGVGGLTELGCSATRRVEFQMFAYLCFRNNKEDGGNNFLIRAEMAPIESTRLELNQTDSNWIEQNRVESSRVELN